MQYFVKKARAIAQAGVAGLAVAAALFASHSAFGDGFGTSMGRTAPALNTSHQAELQLSANDPLPQTRRITIGLHKSMLVNLHRELRDVVVSSPDIMDAVVQSSDRVYLIGKKVGQSNAFLFDARGELILTLEVMVDHDTAALDSMLQRLLPGSTIKSEILNETVILTGSVRSPIDSTRASDIASRFIVGSASASDDRHKNKVINMLAVAGEEQVMLRVTVAEVQRSVLKQFGINVGAIVNTGNFTTSLLSENALPLSAARGLGTLPIPGIPTTGDLAGRLALYNAGPNGAGAPFGNSGMTGGWSSGGNAVAGAIRALERDGLLKTLAEPNLTAVSGETAKFLAGGEFPIPVVDTQGSLTVTFKEFGVGLAFTPVVLSEGRISLKIETEVSELTNQGAVTLNNIQIPALKKRQAKSTVEMPSGGSLALAGLIADDVRQNIDGFPGLKDVPVLGTLFRSRDYIKEETELVVIVTPYMVRPVAQQKLARPGDGLAPATDMKANFLGHLNRIYGRGAPMPDGGLKGDYGFIVE